MIESTDGTVSLSDGDIRLTRGLGETEFLKATPEKRARLVNENVAHRMYALTFPSIFAQVYFENGQLWMVLLSLRVDTEERWSNWSEDRERQRRQAHDALLRADLGEPPYTFTWGTVESGIDPKSGDSQIIVKYRREFRLQPREQTHR